MLLSDATLVTLDPPTVERGDLRVEGARIVERGRGLPAHPDEETLSLGGALVMPGLVNAHTHLYSALARGMPAPAQAPRNFVEILQRVWWRLDRALDLEAVELSGLVGALDAALSGTTLLIDHHASPGCISGSLGVLRGALERVGLRSVLCYETTDRDRPSGRDQGLEENRAFLAAGPTELTRGLVGAHASFTLSDETLEAMSALVAESGSGFHVHVAEDLADVRDCRARHGLGLVERFARHGLLGPRTLLAHGVHLEPGELDLVHQRGAWILHNPRSNMNNAVGYAPAQALERAALGTDGMDQDMWAEARVAFLKLREAGRPDAFATPLRMLARGHALAHDLFGLPFGRLESGAPADLLLLDYRPPTPLTAENLAGHLLFGLDRSHMRSVLVAGRFVVRDRRVMGIDVAELQTRAQAAATRLWQRMSS